MIGQLLTEIIGREDRVAELSTYFADVLLGTSGEEDSFEMHELLGWDVVYYVYEKDFLLQDLGARVDHRNDDWEIMLELKLCTYLRWLDLG